MDKRTSHQSSRYDDMNLEELVAGGDASVEEKKRKPIAKPVSVEKKRGRPPKRKQGKKMKQKEDEEEEDEDEEDDGNNNAIVLSDSSPSRPPRKVVAKKLDVEGDNDKVLDWDFQKVCLFVCFVCLFLVRFMGFCFCAFCVFKPSLSISMATFCELFLAKVTLRDHYTCTGSENFRKG